MARGLNQVLLKGTVASDILVRLDEPKKKLVTFRMKVRKERRGRGDKIVQYDTFVTVQAWGGLAGMVRDRLEKGMWLLFSGELVNREQEDNVKRMETEVRISDLHDYGINESGNRTSNISRNR